MLTLCGYRSQPTPAVSGTRDIPSFDRVVSTLVLCTVDDPESTIGEVSRALRWGGKLLYLEHVRSPDARLARWQDRLDRPWGWFAGGCHPNRDIERMLRSSPLDVERLTHGEMPHIIGPLIRPMIHGALTAATTAAAPSTTAPDAPR